MLEPNDLTLGLKRKKVRIYDYPDGTIEIRYDGHPLPYSAFDKVQEITPTEIVNNKWIGVSTLSYLPSVSQFHLPKGLTFLKNPQKDLSVLH